MGEIGRKPPTTQAGGAGTRNELTAPDDPGDLEAAPSTARPDVAPEKLAAQLDAKAEAERMTQPPTPTYDMLRDSCRIRVAKDVALDEEKILRPTSGTPKVSE